MGRERQTCKPRRTRQKAETPTISRGRARYDHSIPVLRLPMGAAVPSVIRSRVAEVSGDDERSLTFTAVDDKGSG